jgi:hypothetical protein
LNGEGGKAQLDLNTAHLLSLDGSPVTVRFKLNDGSEFGYVRADRCAHYPTGVMFMMGLEVVAGLGPLKLIIYKHDGTEASVDRSRLSDPPFVISQNSLLSDAAFLSQTGKIQR